MVMTNHTWEEETRKTLTQIQSELNNAQKQYEEAKSNLERLSKEAETMELALQIHLQRTGKQGIIQHDMRELLVNQRNHEERLKRMAERNNGLIKVSLAADILYNYHLLKSKARMNAYRIVYGLMLKMTEEGIFQKSGPAEFRLVGTQTKLPTVS